MGILRECEFDDLFEAGEAHMDVGLVRLARRVWNAFVACMVSASPTLGQTEHSRDLACYALCIGQLAVQMTRTGWAWHTCEQGKFLSHCARVECRGPRIKTDIPFASSYGTRRTRSWCGTRTIGSARAVAGVSHWPTLLSSSPSFWPGRRPRRHRRHSSSASRPQSETQSLERRACESPGRRTVL